MQKVLRETLKGVTLGTSERADGIFRWEEKDSLRAKRVGYRSSGERKSHWLS